MAVKPHSLLILTIAITTSYYNTEAFEAKNIKTFGEVPCLSVGGICLPSKDCFIGKQAPVKGLCPLQEKNGIECCFSLPISETRCQKNGGECLDKKIQCPDNLTFMRATDCSPDEKCCILVY